ncbi:regulatory protein RecX [Aquipuribacter sp. SD81]|uniref:regulatory protein RecX n=1 Tax=Aquipuribacter sp. SD81 TaxID=3127703 RepID=UPI0030190AFA
MTSPHPETHDGARPSSDGSSPEPPEEVARAVVLRQLSFGARTRAQLRAKVLAKDVPDDVADAVLDRMGEVGLVDDRQFAHDWVRSRHRSKGLSRRGLADELRRKGVDRDLADEALGQLDGDDERAAAERLVAKRLPSVRGLERQRAANRLMGMLARKGYPAGLAGEVVRQALAADDA